MNNTNLFNLSIIKKVLLIISLTFLALVIFNISQSKPADAYLGRFEPICPTPRGPFSGNVPTLSNMPSWQYDYLNCADVRGQSPSVSFFGTMANDWTSQTTTVNAGTNTLNLAFHGAATVGCIPSSTTNVRYNVVSTSAGTSGIWGEFVQTNIPSYNTCGYSARATPNTFTWTANFPTTNWYTVTLNTRVVNQFAGGFYRCVANGAATSNLTGSNCPITPVGITIRVIVRTTDVCANIAGTQASIPAGYVKVGANCYRPPTCSFSNSAISGGFRLSWSSSNATSVSINQGIGGVGTSGSRDVGNTSTTYTMAASGPGGSTTCTTRTTAVNPPPTCSISNTIRSGGFTLNWSSTNATSASLSGVGSVGTSGPRNVGATNTTYTLTVRGPGGTANCRTTTTVPANPSCSLTINNTALTITWSSSNATTMSINQGIGNVSTSGGTTGISPSLGTTTYTGTVVNAIGARDTCTRSITISPPSCNLTINSDATSISWTTTNAVSLTIDNGVGNATPVDSGVRTINPQFGTTTYNGTVRNIIGTTRTCDDSITISVPTCNSVQILRTSSVVTEVPAGEPFATRVNLRNDNPFVIEVNSAGYTVNSPPSGSSRTNQSSTNSNNMSANSNASYRSNNTEDIRLNGPGTFTVSWTINTTRGTINCSGQVISTVEPITCTVARVENSIGLRFSVGVTLINPNSINIGITESSWDSTNITPASGVGVTVRGSSVTLDSDGGGVDLSSSITIDSRDDLEANTTGDRSVTWTIVTEYSDSDPTGDCGDNGTELGVTASPYPRFYGNDVFAGGGFGNCTIASGDVRSYGEFFGSPDHSTYVGAASELAIFAAGQIEQVLPGSQYDSRNRLDALSFANSSGATALADLGGSFGVPLCADSFTTVDTSTFSNLASTTINLSSGDSGDYRRTGDVTISGGSSIVNGQRVQVYVDGDVLISENIIYSGANSGGWNSISDIPLIRVYATGNIYIDRGVNEISGLYAADGTVYTCTAGTTTFTGASFDQLSQDATGCRSKLTIYGSIVSDSIELHRTSGSYGQTDPAAIPEPYTSGNIAESFVFSPELYLALLSEGTSNVTAKFDSILSLPPAF